MSITTASLLPDPPSRLHEEERLHRAVVQYLKWALPDDAVYFHIANGGKRHKIVAAKLAALGVRAGLPDLEIIWAGLDGKSIFIELKTERGALSSVQRQMHQRLLHCKAVVCVCRGVGEVADALSGLGMALRVRLA